MRLKVAAAARALDEYAAGPGEFHPHPLDVPQLVAYMNQMLKSTKLPQ
jgi:hypothetical protein